MKTILITGCSSGFGLETAKYFLEREWNVIATMRTPREDIFPPYKNLRIIQLDVTKPESIRKAVEEAGEIDVLVNNAGIGAAFPFEAGSMTTVRDVFETNTFGLMALTQAFLPQFREQKSGTIINVTSSVTLKSLPLMSAYTASKAAVNAFTECLALELDQFNIKVHIVLPGRSPETPFAENGRQTRMQGLDNEAYAELVKSLFSRLTDNESTVTYARDVAEAIWRAVNDPSSPIKIPAGADSVEWAKDWVKDAGIPFESATTKLD